MSVSLAGKTLTGPLSFEHHLGTLAIMGPSGSGKTTLAKAILALLSPCMMQGELSFNGICLQKDGRILVKPQDRRFGYVPQGCAPWPHLSIAKALGLAKRLSPDGGHPFQVEALADLFGLRPFLSVKPQALSGGQKQRLLLACAIAACPRLLVLDEAFSGLDVIAKIELITLIKELQQKWPFLAIFITHDMAEALAVADSILILEKGQTIWHGPKETLNRRSFSKRWNPFLSPLLAPHEHYRGARTSSNNPNNLDNHPEP